MIKEYTVTNSMSKVRFGGKPEEGYTFAWDTGREPASSIQWGAHYDWDRPFTGKSNLLLITEMPSSLEKLDIKLGQVLSYEPALELLAKVYEEVVLPISSLVKDCKETSIIAVGLLAAAGLCEVSPLSIRLSPEGCEFVRHLSENEEQVALWQARY